jgi:hypothetical protein
MEMISKEVTRIINGKLIKEILTHPRYLFPNTKIEVTPTDKGIIFTATTYIIHRNKNDTVRYINIIESFVNSSVSINEEQVKKRIKIGVEKIKNRLTEQVTLAQHFYTPKIIE